MNRFSDRGSTPLDSTKKKEDAVGILFLFGVMIWREPTLTEPAGENAISLDVEIIKMQHEIQHENA